MLKHINYLLEKHY